jgi:hypothetical protein
MRECFGWQQRYLIGIKINNKRWSERSFSTKEWIKNSEQDTSHYSLLPNPKSSPLNEVIFETTNKFPAFFSSLSFLRSIPRSLQIHFFLPSFGLLYSSDFFFLALASYTFILTSLTGHSGPSQWGVIPLFIKTMAGNLEFWQSEMKLLRWQTGHFRRHLVETYMFRRRGSKVIV